MPSFYPPHSNKSFGSKVSRRLHHTYNEILKQVKQIVGKDSQTLWCSVCILYSLKYNSFSHIEEGCKSESKGVRVFSVDICGAEAVVPPTLT